MVTLATARVLLPDDAGVGMFLWFSEFVDSPLRLSAAPAGADPVPWFAVIVDSPVVSFDVASVDVAPRLAAFFP